MARSRAQAFGDALRQLRTDWKIADAFETRPSDLLRRAERIRGER